MSCGISREGDLRMGSKRVCDQLPIAVLIVRVERRRADRLQRHAIHRNRLSRRIWQRADLLQKPVQKRGPHRRAVKASDQALGDFDRKAACAIRERFLRRFPLLVDRRLRRRLQRRRFLRDLFQTRGPFVLRGFVGGREDAIAFLREAGARPCDLGERCVRLSALRVQFRQSLLRCGAALLDDGRDRAPEEPAAAARPG